MPNFEMRNGFKILFLLIIPFTLSAQEVRVLTEYPSVVRNGQQFSIIYEVNAGGGELAVPSFSGFYKLMGPHTAYSSSTQIINGKVSHNTSHTYTYYLQAVEEGVFTIAPARFTLKNKTYYSDTIRIEVIPDGAAQGGNAAAGVPGRQQPETGSPDTGGEEISISLILNKREPYIGEGILATVKLYTQTDLSGISEIKYPSFNGFMKADLETPPLTSLTRENINGTTYGTGVIQQFILYPQMAGEITIDPVQITVLVRQRSGMSDPFFGDFFSTFQTVQKPVASRAVKINVKPLPGNKPDDFSGVVGKMNLTASLDHDSVNVNDAVNFKVIMSGTGNIRLAEAPVLNLSPDIETYEPRITENLKNTSTGTTGQKVFEFPLIPRHHGDFVIPPVTCSFFNTSTGKYEQLSTKEFRFHARKTGDQSTGVTVYGGVSRQDVQYLGQDIRFIRSEAGKLLRQPEFYISSRVYFSIFAVALMLFFVVLFIRREHIRRNADISAVRNRKAGKIAAQRLREASECLKKGDTDRFHEEILKALWGYLSDKLNIPVSTLTRTNAISTLSERGADEQQINRLTEILDKCEYARYSPSGGTSEAKEIYEGASQLIRSIENIVSRK
ncbi:MAG: protein BatD [Bacteroidales bacterium]|nr:protein BatD [Bacteroidales bacterium]MBN2634376.1 protein BatD [Bacteroidales bacterium]